MYRSFPLQSLWHADFASLQRACSEISQTIRDASVHLYCGPLATSCFKSLRGCLLAGVEEATEDPHHSDRRPSARADAASAPAHGKNKET